MVEPTYFRVKKEDCRSTFTLGFSNEVVVSSKFGGYLTVSLLCCECLELAAEKNMKPCV